MFHVAMPSSPRPAMPPPPLMHRRLVVREAWPQQRRASPTPAAEGQACLPRRGEATGSPRLPRRPAPSRASERSHLLARGEAGHRLQRVDPSGSKEVLQRALSPPVQRRRRGETAARRRCWNFRPTPSRLSNMSMATS